MPYIGAAGNAERNSSGVTRRDFPGGSSPSERPPSRTDRRPSRLPLDLIAHDDLAVVEHFGERAPAPTFAHGLLQTGQCAFHLFAGSGLTMDAKAAITDPQGAASRVFKIDPAQQKIRSASAGIERRGELSHQLGPALTRDERNLSLACLIRVAGEASAANEPRPFDRIHRPALETFDPDLL
jgi:hypothetical protein